MADPPAHAKRSAGECSAASADSLLARLRPFRFASGIAMAGMPVWSGADPLRSPDVGFAAAPAAGARVVVPVAALPASPVALSVARPPRTAVSGTVGYAGIEYWFFAGFVRALGSRLAEDDGVAARSDASRPVSSRPRQAAARRGAAPSSAAGAAELT